MKRNIVKHNSVYLSLLIFIIAQVLVFVTIAHQDYFLTEHDIYFPTQPPEVISVWPGTITTTTPITTTTTLPSGQITETTTTVMKETPVTGYSSLGPILIYFFSVVVVLGVILFLVPIRVLRMILKGLFVILFCWGMFIFLVMWIPLVITIVISFIIAIIWFFTPRVWLHNTVLILALVSVGAVFGRLISPWTSMIILAVLAIYDYLAVRFGYMVWMAKKMSETTSLPAIIIPYNPSGWNTIIKTSDFVVRENPSDRKFAILGGGDIGFSLLLTASVYFASGLTPALIIAVFSFLGLICAYWIQAYFLKGRPMPALPPIAGMCLIGLLITSFL
jgi:presenilin-like A22 family membrane protease